MKYFSVCSKKVEEISKKLFFVELNMMKLDFEVKKRMLTNYLCEYYVEENSSIVPVLLTVGYVINDR